YVETLARRGYRFIGLLDQTLVQAPPQTAARLRLAVVPFFNLSADSDQEYFSRRFTEEMIAPLSRVHPGRLRGVARGRSMQYKETNKGIDQIGEELQVNYILEGSVRRASNRARITARLIVVKEQTPLWAESYDRELSDIFSIQYEVAEKVGRSLALELLTRPGAAQRRTTDAHDAYLWGRFYWNQTSEAGMKAAIRCFEQALELDPSYALAYTGIADCCTLLGWFG